jgi:C-terminal processing protease CtpA/Prc
MDRPLFKDDAALIKLEFDDTLGVALLTVKTFDNDLLKGSNQEKFKSTMRKAFYRMDTANVSNLIIDLRGNEGGDPMMEKIVLENILQEKYKISLELRAVKKGHLESFEARTKSIWVPYFGLGNFKPNKNNYTGNVYVLVDGGSSSAAAEFAGIIRKHNRATFIGSESGGNPVLLSGALFDNMHLLPNTKLKSFVG